MHSIQIWCQNLDMMLFSIMSLQTLLPVSFLFALGKNKEEIARVLVIKHSLNVYFNGKGTVYILCNQNFAHFRPPLVTILVKY